jgi:hypothetical protein
MRAQPLTRFEERARQKGIAAAAPDLPVTTRSLTAEEVRANDGRVAMIGFGIYLAFAVLFAVMALAVEGMPLWTAPAVILGAIPVGLVARARARRRRDYRDPGIAVTVSESGVTLRQGTRSDEISYPELSVPKIIFYSSNNAVVFLGIELRTAISSLNLEEGWFKGGTRAAGSILKQLEQRNLPVGGSRR